MQTPYLIIDMKNSLKLLARVAGIFNILQLYMVTLIIINKWWESLTDDARVVIYDCNMFIVQATAYFYPPSVTKKKKVL